MTTDELKTLKGMLLNGTATVTFTKLDGEERVMRCTWLKDNLPEDFKGDVDSPSDEDKQYLAVWDLDKEAWRSFRIDRVKKFIGVSVEVEK